MSVRAELRSRALLWALALGVLADLLVRVDGRPGVNIMLWAVAGVSALIVLVRQRGDDAARETWWLVGGALAFACALALRDAEALAVFALFGAVVLLILAAGRGSDSWASRAHVSDIVFSVLRAAALGAAGPLGWGRGVPDTTRVSGGRRWARTFLRGAVMALPALFLLTSLLMTADPVFERVVRDTLSVDIEGFIEHLAFAAVIGWIAAGYLRAFLVRDDAVAERYRVPAPGLPPAELSVALWILNVLFIAFMAVQLRYLFGGADLVEVTAGLSYAEYARRGFFELVATAALVVPILLLADWAARRTTERPGVVLRATMLVLVVLLLGVIASAAYRMHLYQDAYGLTEQRLYVSVFIVWLTTVLGLFVLTVLRGRRERFAFGSIIAGLACIAVLHVINPHAMIARVNIDRALAGAEYDGTYLRSLSADAVPVLFARLDQLPEAERCRVTEMLVERWSGERRGGWRTWNLSDWRARRLVAAHAADPSCPGVAVSTRRWPTASTSHASSSTGGDHFAERGRMR